MGDTTLTSAVGAHVLSLHQPAELFGSKNKSAAVSGSSSTGSNPIDFFTPSSVSNRASDLYRLQDGATSTIKALQKAQSSIQKIQSLVSEAEAIVRSAGALSTETASATSSVSGLNGQETLESAFGLDSGDSITVGDGAQTLTISADGATSVNDLVETINSDETLGIKASLSNGSLKLDAVGDNVVTASVQDNSGDANDISDIGFTDLGDNVVAEAGSLSLNRLGLSNDFNAILEEIDQAVKDADLNGANLLKGSSFVEKFGPNSDPTISVEGVDFDSEGLGLTTADNFLQTGVDVLNSIAELDAAAVTLERQSAIYAADQTSITINQGFSGGLIDTLEAGSKINVSALEEEVVGLLAQQTKELISTESDPLTNPGDQDFLKSID